MSKFTAAESDEGPQTHGFSHIDADEQNWACKVSVTSSPLDFESRRLPPSKVRGPPTAGCVLRVSPGLSQKEAGAHVAHGFSHWAWL